MASFKANTVYSYKKGKGGSCGTRVGTTFTVYGQSESAVMSAIRKKHYDHPGIEIIIHSVVWK